MNNEILITKESGSLTTTSKVIADVFGKAHRKVTRDIEAIDCSDEFSTANFGLSQYSTDRGKTYKCYNITKDGFFMLAMGFNGKKAAYWKEEFIKEFNRLQASEFSIQNEMDNISNEIDCINDAGKAWSKMGLAVKKRKKIATQKKIEFVKKVQFSLNFNSEEKGLNDEVV